MSNLDRAKMLETIVFCNGNKDIMEKIGEPIVIKDEMTDEAVAEILTDTLETIKDMFLSVTCEACGRTVPDPDEGKECAFCKQDVTKEVEPEQETPAPPAPPAPPVAATEEAVEEVKVIDETPAPPAKKKRTRRTKAQIEADKKDKETQPEQPATEAQNINISDEKSEEILKGDNNIVVEEKKDCECKEESCLVNNNTNMTQFLIDTNATIQISAKDLAKVFKA